MTSKSNITNIIESALCRIPGVVGKRLRSETDLANFFDVGRWTLRCSLNQLVEKGVLARRRGSGTFVRKVPESTAYNLEQLPSLNNEFPSAADLFADTTAGHSMRPELKLPLYKRALNLSLWSSLTQFRSLSNQIVLNSIVRRTSEKNHHLLMNTMLERPGVLLTVSEIARQIREKPGDGYIVVAPWADLFEKALEGRKVPVIYFADSTYCMPQRSTIILDTYSEIRNVVPLFKQEGYQRLAFLTLHSWRNDDEERKHIFEQAVLDSGLSYSKFIIANNLGECLKPLNEILSAEDRPDAIFVSDDNLLPEVTAALTMNHLIPGRDIGIIAQTYFGCNLPTQYNWSQLAHDLEFFGSRIVDNLLQNMQSSNPPPYTTAIHSKWIAGDTHKRR